MSSRKSFRDGDAGVPADELPAALPGPPLALVPSHSPPRHSPGSSRKVKCDLAHGSATPVGLSPSTSGSSSPPGPPPPPPPPPPPAAASSAGASGAMRPAPLRLPGERRLTMLAAAFLWKISPLFSSVGVVASDQTSFCHDTVPSR